MNIEEARLQKARDLVKATLSAGSHSRCNCRAEIDAGEWDKGQKVRVALAALVEANWQPPEDPDVDIVRNILVASYGVITGLGEGPQRVRDIRDGNADTYWEMRAALAAYKAGKVAQ